MTQLPLQDFNFTTKTGDGATKRVLHFHQLSNGSDEPSLIVTVHTEKEKISYALDGNEEGILREILNQRFMLLSNSI